MTKVVVSEKALHELVREALDNKELSGWSGNEGGPAHVDSNVDPSVAVTNPVNPRFTPQTKTEFGIAVGQLVKDLPDTEMPAIYKAVKQTLKVNAKKEDQEEMTKNAAQGGTKQVDAKSVEESVRKAVRDVLFEVMPKRTGWGRPRVTKMTGPIVGDLPPVTKIPAGQHGAEYLARGEKYNADLKKLLKQPLHEPVEDVEEELPEEEPLPGARGKHGYKKTAIGGMSDVGGSSFEDIAKELGFSVAGAKQAVDKALEKAQFLAKGMDDDDREIMILTAMNDYIKMLAKSGELTGSDVQLMKDHPTIVRELDGFREFLHNTVRKARKSDQALVNPMDESDGEEKKKPESKPVTKSKSAATGKDIEVNWGKFGEGLNRETISRLVEAAYPMEPDAYPPEMESVTFSEPCPYCESENTISEEPIPSMTGSGSDQALKCLDCGKTSFAGPEIPSPRRRS